MLPGARSDRDQRELTWRRAISSRPSVLSLPAYSLFFFKSFFKSQDSPHSFGTRRLTSAERHTGADFDLDRAARIENK